MTQRRLIEGAFPLKKVSAAAPHEKAALQRRTEMTDREIDGLLYEIYALAPEEIAVVEEAEAA